ncbi:glycine cleavage system aminomethyltransferase GcvT [Nitrospiraceae bacterium AH_259_D15_M11_P09]|nr:glycine cleavage system aminomethyltransferase GcvT [Nitrospiraceae bacterium AH_259_D15_M11_P09]
MTRTPLYDAQAVSGAKLVDFFGWELPIHYAGVVNECHAVRSAAGLFDVCHMGRITVSGQGALGFIQHVATNNAAKLSVLRSQYSMVCNEQGGIKDDIFVYRTKAEEFLLCVNASNREKMVAWLQEQAAGLTDVELKDRSLEWAQLALQGPASRSILSEMGVIGVDSLKPRQGLDTSLLGVRSLITRTGYTGELGYELYVPADSAVWIWNELLARGKSAGIKPAGLGARDLLRLEMGYLLYGNDISETTSPLEAGAEWAVDFEKGDFTGRDALLRQKGEGIERRLVAFELLQKAVPRHGCKIVSTGEPEDKEIGEVTSGNLSSILQKGIGLGYVPPARAKVGASFAIDIRGRTVPAVVVTPPFYKKQARGESPSPTLL